MSASSKSLKVIGSQMMMVRGTALTPTPERAGAVFSVTSPIRSIAVFLVQVIRDLEDSMSTMNAHGTRTWSYFSSLWSALKLNFAEWQRRAVSRRLTRIAADIEACHGTGEPAAAGTDHEAKARS
jgi:hypothetical protein